MRLLLALLSLVVVCLLSHPAYAQKESVNPGINKSFETPNPKEYIERFEREGRDIYDRREAILASCQIKQGMSVADIGAGTGLFTRMFSATVGPTGKVWAVDISDEFIDHILKTAKDAGLTNVEGVVCLSDSVGLPEGSIDLAFICDVYHHFEFPERTMRSLYKALKPRGIVVLIDFHRIPGVSSDFAMSHVRAGQEVFAKEITDCGFKQIEEKKDLLGDSYFLRFEKVGE